jgi:hypothetical protein
MEINSMATYIASRDYCYSSVKPVDISTGNFLSIGSFCENIFCVFKDFGPQAKLSDKIRFPSGPVCKWLSEIQIL